MDAGGAHRAVLGVGGLLVGVRARARVAELHVRRELLRARACAPGHHRLGHPARRDRLDHAVLLDASNLRV